ncbi:hypothetical protein GBA52_009514 [Prunus armeniaca]|nr:hypothetical protein GBA52_009514 [Prunus armeniaca]
MAYPRWFNHIQLASYSQQALLLVSGGGESWSNYGNLIEDVGFFWCGWVSLMFSFNLDRINGALHSLAQFGLQEGRSFYS